MRLGFSSHVGVFAGSKSGFSLVRAGESKWHSSELIMGGRALEDLNIKMGHQIFGC